MERGRLLSHSKLPDVLLEPLGYGRAFLLLRLEPFNISFNHHADKF